MRTSGRRGMRRAVLVGILLAGLASASAAAAVPPAPQGPTLPDIEAITTVDVIEAIPPVDVVVNRVRARLESELARVRVQQRVDIAPEIRIRIDGLAGPAHQRLAHAREISRAALAEARLALEIEHREILRLRHAWLGWREPEHASGLAGRVVEWTPKLGVLLGAVVEVAARLLLTGMELTGLA